MNKILDYIWFILGIIVGVFGLSVFKTDYDFYYRDIGKTFKLRDHEIKNFYSQCTATVLGRYEHELVVIEHCPPEHWITRNESKYDMIGDDLLIKESK